MSIKIIDEMIIVITTTIITINNKDYIEIVIVNN